VLGGERRDPGAEDSAPDDQEVEADPAQTLEYGVPLGSRSRDGRADGAARSMPSSTVG
jgi:hypothetical protein